VAEGLFFPLRILQIAEEIRVWLDHKHVAIAAETVQIGFKRPVETIELRITIKGFSIDRG
jgi:hypothetical protein